MTWKSSYSVSTGQAAYQMNTKTTLKSNTTNVRPTCCIGNESSPPTLAARSRISVEPVGAREQGARQRELQRRHTAQDAMQSQRTAAAQQQCCNITADYTSAIT